MASPKASPIGLLAIAGFLVFAGLAIYWKTAATDTGQARRGGGPVPVAVVTAGETVFVDRIDALGTARANESVAITAKVTETVSGVGFSDGDIVEAGAILVELTDDEDQAELDAARANLQEAQRTFERSSDLMGSGNITLARLDQVRAARDAAQARVAAIEARLADRLIRAPFSGVLGLRNVSQGTLVRPGDVITTLDDISDIKLDFTVPESFVGALRVGLPINATAAAFPDRTFEGKILAAETRIDPVTRAVKVRAALPNPDQLLKPGMLMTVEVIKQTLTGISVPERSVIARGDETFVYVVEGTVPSKSIVTVGRRQDGLAQILDGVSKGELVVSDGTHRVRPGQPVRIVEKDGAAAKAPNEDRGT